MHRAKGDMLVRARVLPVCDNAEGPNAVAHTYCKIFARVFFSRSFAEVKSSQNGEVTLSFTDCENHALAANLKRR